MHNFKDLDIRDAEIRLLGNGAWMIDYPAYSYLVSEDTDELALVADEGGVHLGERKPGVAVLLKSINHGMMFKQFGIGFYDNGEPFAYGKATAITADPQAKETLAGAMVGDSIILRDKRYRIEQAPNQNIDLVEEA